MSWAQVSPEEQQKLQNWGLDQVRDLLQRAEKLRLSLDHRAPDGEATLSAIRGVITRAEQMKEVYDLAPCHCGISPMMRVMMVRRAEELDT